MFAGSLVVNVFPLRDRGKHWPCSSGIAGGSPPSARSSRLSDSVDLAAISGQHTRGDHRPGPHRGLQAKTQYRKLRSDYRALSSLRRESD